MGIKPRMIVITAVLVLSFAIALIACGESGSKNVNKSPVVTTQEDSEAAEVNVNMDTALQQPDEGISDKTPAQIETLVDAWDENVSLQFDKVAAFNADGIALVIKDDILSFVDSSGTIVTQTDIACSSAEWIKGCNLVEFKDKEMNHGSYSIGIADMSGAVCIPLTYGLNIDPEGCSDGLIWCRIELEVDLDKFTGYTSREVFWLNDEGEIAIPKGLYNAGSTFHDGLAWVTMDSELSNGEINYDIDGGFIDATGELVIQLSNLGFHEGDVIEEQYFEGGFAAISVAARDNLVIDTEGKIVIPGGEYNGILGIINCGDGTFIVEKNDKKGLIDSSGEILIPIEYDNIRKGSEGFYPYVEGDGDNELWGYLDRKGNEVIPSQYAKVSEFINGRAYVGMTSEQYSEIIDQNGNLVDRDDTDDIMGFDVKTIAGNMVQVKVWADFGDYILHDNNGNSVINIVYEGQDSGKVPVYFEGEFYDEVLGIIITDEVNDSYMEIELVQFARIYNYAGEGVYPYDGVPSIDKSYRGSESPFLWTVGDYKRYGIIHVNY